MHPHLARLISREQIHQRTPPWFAKRGNMVTASQVASVLGQCPYKSAVQLLKEKVWPELRQNSDSFATNWGNNYESDAIQKYEKLTGKRVLNFGLLQHVDHEWIGASPDGVAAGGPDDTPIAIEVKCPVSREITAEVPRHYMPQIQLQLEVMDLEEADFVQYRPASLWREEEFVITRVKRDREWWRKAFPLMQKFYAKWQELKAQKEAGAPTPPNVIVRRAGHPRELRVDHTTTQPCPFQACSPTSSDDERLDLDRVTTATCPFRP